MAILTQEQLNAIAQGSGYTGGSFSNVGTAPAAQVSNESLGLKTAPVSVLSSTAGQNIVNQNTQKLNNIESSYMGPSIVDYLNSTGQASDFGSRSKLAGEKGIQNYTGTAQQNTQLLQALRNVSSSPASTAMVGDINKMASSGIGMTQAEREGLSNLQATQDNLTTAAAKAKAALETKDYRSLDYWTAKADESRSQYEKELSDYFESTKELRNKLSTLAVPGAREQELSQKLNDIRSQAEQFNLQTEEDKFNEYGGQSLGFAGGRAAQIDRKASFKRQEFALKEKNLLLSLGLEQAAREMETQSVEQQLSYLASDFELQQQVEEKLTVMEDALFSKADTLQGDSKTALISILGELQGVDPSKLDAKSIKDLEDLASRAGIPFNLVVEALSTQHARETFDNALRLAQETRLGSNSSSTSSTTQERLNQILDGFITFEDLTPTERQKVRDELYDKGFNSDEPPAWFKEYIQNEFQQTVLPDVLKSEWIKYRDSVLESANKKSGSSLDDIFNEV